MSTSSAIWLALVLLLGNAFFVGAEFALVSARRTKVEPLAAEGSRVARTTLRAMEELSHTLDALDEAGAAVAVPARQGPGQWSNWPTRLARITSRQRP